MLFFLQNSFSQTEIILFDLPGAEQFRSSLQSVKAFPAHQDPAGIPVQTVHDSGMKGGKLFLRDLMRIQQIAGQIFHGGGFFRTIRLGKHAGRLVDQQKIIVFIEDLQISEDSGILLYA